MQILFYKRHRLYSSVQGLLLWCTWTRTECYADRFYPFDSNDVPPTVAAPSRMHIDRAVGVLQWGQSSDEAAGGGQRREDGADGRQEAINRQKPQMRNFNFGEGKTHILYCFIDIFEILWIVSVAVE